MAKEDFVEIHFGHIAMFDQKMLSIDESKKLNAYVKPNQLGGQ